MFIPIIIPMFNRFDDDDDRRHGSGCQCPECLEKKKRESMPREYYQYRYAIPKKFIIKNTIFKICRLLMILMGIWLIFLPLYTFKYPMNYLTDILLPMFLGFGIIIAGVVIFGNFILWDFQCKDKIYLTADYFATKEDWDKIIKEKNINKEKYKLTKIETNWRYK